MRELRERVRVRLPRGELEVSRLGFGTAALMSRVNRRDSVRLLETALDGGVTHFDTARSYGFGEAEGVVSEVLAGRRHQITVATKVGILPPRRSAGLSAAKAVARTLQGALPAMRGLLRRGAGGLIRANCFETAAMTESLHTSLRQLRTEYVDFLLLHEPSVEVLSTDEPLRFLERVQREGKVRGFGVAVMPEVAAYALEHAPEYAAVLQIPHSAFQPSLERLGKLTGVMFTHSAMGMRFGELGAGLRADAGLARRWSEALDLDATGEGQLSRLALQWALAELPQGVVLFSSTVSAHVREDAAALKTAAPAEQMERFGALVAEWNAREAPPSRPHRKR